MNERLPVWPRGTVDHFVRHHELPWDIAMAALTVAYVVLAFTEGGPLGWQEYVVWGLSVVFLAEFGVRCYDSLDRSRYLRSHWLDLITAVPVPGIPGLRMIRLLRLLRFANVGALLRRELFRHGWDGGQLIWPTLALFWLASALALWLVEHDAPGSTITTFPDAMTAAFLTAATLGFGHHTFATVEGQIISALIVFFALGLWGFASSNLTRMWLQAKQDVVAPEMQYLVEEVQGLRRQVSELTEALMQRHLVIGEPMTSDSDGVMEAEPVVLGQAATSPN